MFPSIASRIFGASFLVSDDLLCSLDTGDLVFTCQANWAALATRAARRWNAATTLAMDDNDDAEESSTDSVWTHVGVVLRPTRDETRLLAHVCSKRANTCLATSVSAQSWLSSPSSAKSTTSPPPAVPCESSDEDAVMGSPGECHVQSLDDLEEMEDLDNVAPPPDDSDVFEDEPESAANDIEASRSSIIAPKENNDDNGALYVYVDGDIPQYVNLRTQIQIEQNKLVYGRCNAWQNGAQMNQTCFACIFERYNNVPLILESVDHTSPPDGLVDLLSGGINVSGVRLVTVLGRVRTANTLADMCVRRLSRDNIPRRPGAPYEDRQEAREMQHNLVELLLRHISHAPVTRNDNNKYTGSTTDVVEDIVSLYDGPFGRTDTNPAATAGNGDFTASVTMPGCIMSSSELVARALVCMGIVNKSALVYDHDASIEQCTTSDVARLPNKSLQAHTRGAYTDHRRHYERCVHLIPSDGE